MNKRLYIIDQMMYGCDAIQTEVVYDPETKEKLFSVSNLEGCPEDASIERDLPSAYDAQKLLKAGIKYALQGYDGIEYTTITCNSDEWISDVIRRLDEPDKKIG